MRQAITLVSIELKCDACGAVEGEYQTSEIGAHMIGRPCPACGANLLTEQDMNAMHKVLGVKDMINKILGPVVGSKKQIRHEIVAVNPHGKTLTIESRPLRLPRPLRREANGMGGTVGG